MRNLTPTHLRCSYGGCPSVYDVTPEHLRCGDSLTCPSVFEIADATPEHLICPAGDCPSVSTIGDGQMLLIIGKKPSPELLAEIEGRVGEDEYAIVIGADYFANLQRQEALERVHIVPAADPGDQGNSGE